MATWHSAETAPFAERGLICLFVDGDAQFYECAWYTVQSEGLSPCPEVLTQWAIKEMPTGDWGDGEDGAFLPAVVVPKAFWERLLRKDVEGSGMHHPGRQALAEGQRGRKGQRQAQAAGVSACQAVGFHSANFLKLWRRLWSPGGPRQLSPRLPFCGGLTRKPINFQKWPSSSLLFASQRFCFCSAALQGWGRRGETEPGNAGPGTLPPGAGEAGGGGAGEARCAS